MFGLIYYNFSYIYLIQFQFLYRNLMSQNIQDFGSQEERFNRSCNSKIQNDILDHNEIEDSLGQRTVKSQKQQKTYQQQQQEILNLINAAQLNQLKKALNNQQDQKAQKVNQNQLRVFKLGADVIHSEEISLEEQPIGKESRSLKKSISIKQINLSKNNEQNISKLQKNLKVQSQYSESSHKKIIKQVNLNILLLGKSGLGKTSFVDCFIDRKSENIPFIRQKTEHITIKSYEIQNSHNKYKINLIDMPGYQENKIPSFIKEITELINSKYRNHLQFIKEKKDLNKQRYEFVDQRIHCCIFFLSGPWVSDNDWEIMKKIQNITNIIPVIAKGDTYTTSELREFKKNIALKQRISKVNWLSIQQNIRQNFPDKLNKLLQGSFGKAPPFVIICCNQKEFNQKNKKHELVRRFRWGRCELQNQSHHDFKFLKQLIIYNLSSILIRYTDTFLRSYEEEVVISSNQPLVDHSQYVSQNRSLNIQAPIERESLANIIARKIKGMTYVCLTGIGLIVVYKQRIRLV